MTSPRASVWILASTLVVIAACRTEPVAPAPPTAPAPATIVLEFPLEPFRTGSRGIGVGVEYVAGDLRDSRGEAIAAGRAAIREGYALTLFDVSGNGAFEAQVPPFRPRGDGMVLEAPGLRELHVVPFRNRIVMDGASWRVAVKAGPGDGRTLVLTSEHLPGVSDGQLRGIERINVLRARAGLHALAADGECCRGCQAHVETLIRHHWTGNTNPHYGVYGRRSLIGNHARDPVHAVNANDRATYHAKAIYERRPLDVGFGFQDGVFVFWPIGDARPRPLIHSTADEGPRPWVAMRRGGRAHVVTVIPPRGSTGNPSVHRREAQLRGLDENWGGGLGAPVYVLRSSPAFDGLDLEAATLEHGRRAASGFVRVRDVPAHVFSERRPVPGEDDNGGVDCVLAKAPLAPGAYRATFVYEGGVILRWKFHVGD